MIALVVSLIVVGLAFLVVEILIIPGIGIFGILGLGAIVSAGVVAHQYLGPGQAVIALVGGIGLALLLVWRLPKSRLGRSVVLHARNEGKAADASQDALLGRSGVTLSPLRPAGSVEIDGRAVDVVSVGDYVETGRRVRVSAVEGNRIVVEADRG